MVLKLDQLIIWAVTRGNQILILDHLLSSQVPLTTVSSKCLKILSLLHFLLSLQYRIQRHFNCNPFICMVTTITMLIGGDLLFLQMMYQEYFSTLCMTFPHLTLFSQIWRQLKMCSLIYHSFKRRNDVLHLLFYSSHFS